MSNLLMGDERKDVAMTALKLLTTGLVVNTSGNVSIRVGDKIAITPSGMDYEALRPEDICVLDMEGNQLDGQLLPSSETPLHLAVYANDASANSIVHTHSRAATAASMLVEKLPIIHYQMADLGGSVPVAPYATFGTPELAQSVTKVLPGFTAALMQNHGSISTGPNVKKALARTVLLEWCCEVWLKAASKGDPSLLSDEELLRVKAQMDRIGKKREECQCGQHKT